MVCLYEPNTWERSLAVVASSVIFEIYRAEMSQLLQGTAFGKASVPRLSSPKDGLQKFGLEEILKPI